MTAVHRTDARLGAAQATSYPTTTVTVRYFAAARAASGVDEEELTLPAPVTIAAVLAAAVEAHGTELDRVLGRCSYLHNALAVHARDAVMAEGDQLDVLPPFAGG